MVAAPYPFSIAIFNFLNPLDNSDFIVPSFLFKIAAISLKLWTARILGREARKSFRDGFSVIGLAKSLRETLLGREASA